MPSPKNPNTLRRCSHASAVRVMPGTPVEWCGVCGSLRLVKSKVCKATFWMSPGLGRRVIRARLEEAGFYRRFTLAGRPPKK